MSYTPFTCLRCGKLRYYSSNPRADKHGTMCSICALAERDEQRNRPS